MGIAWSSESLTNCKLEERVEMISNSSRKTPCWILYKATSSADTSPVSVFVYTLNNSLNSDKPIMHQDILAYAQNNAQYLKRLRHPCIVQFIDISVTADEVWLITEQLTPLQHLIDSLSPIEICSGLHNILEALDFLHSKAGLCHGSVGVESVFVSAGGRWKLGSMDLTCPVSLSDNIITTQCKVKRPSYHTDLTGFAALATYVLEYAAELGELVTQFVKHVEDLLTDNDLDDKSGIFRELLTVDLLQSDFIEISNFFRFIVIKSEEEKAAFFTDVAARLYGLPVELVAIRLTKLLLSRFVLLDSTACECLLPHLLTPCTGCVRPEVFSKDAVNAFFPRPLFQRFVIPELYKIFHIHDVHIRCVLLRHFYRYAAMFDHGMLTNTVLPELLLGVRDVNDELVMLSLEALAALVPILGGNVVIGENREQIFSRGHPKAVGSAPVVSQINSRRHSEYCVQKVGPGGNRLVDDSIAGTDEECRVVHGSTHGAEGCQDGDSEQGRRISVKAVSPLKLHNEHGIRSQVRVVDDEWTTSDWTSGSAPDSDNGLHVCSSPSSVEHLQDCSTIIPDTPGSPNCLLASMSSCSPNGRTSASGIGSFLPSNGVSLKHAVGTVGTAGPLALQHAVGTVGTASTAGPLALPHAVGTASTVGTAGQLALQHAVGTASTAGTLIASSQCGRLSSGEQLGAECDIKQIKVKTVVVPTPAEFDFFADMAPHIEMKSSDTLLGLLTTTTSPSRFALSNDNIDLGAADGWDVDFNWEQQ